MDDGSNVTIKTKYIYVPELHAMLVYLQIIENQEGNFIMFGTCAIHRDVDPFWTIDIWKNEKGLENMASIRTRTIKLHPKINLTVF